MAKKKPAKKAPPKTQVDSLRHKDKRKNIPTEELRDFVAAEEQQPKTILYPRDPSLDPQLVWKGKDEQDQQDLAVPAVPIYIQEKVHPQAIIDDVAQASQLAKNRRQDAYATQLDLFADFNGLPDEFDQRIDFYQHEGHWSNRMILGDSLLVMTSLAEKEGLKGKVQTIYLDPPYGIKFGSNWQVSTRKRDVKDGKAEDATRQPEQVRAFRDTWELGVHSYLAYLRDRLVLARELLTEGGSLFVQIGDQNVHVVRCLMDEVFGSDNFIAEITFKTSIGLGAEYIDRVSDHIIWFAKQRELLKYRPLYLELVRGEKGATRYNYAEMPDGSVKSIGSLSNNESDGLPEGTRFFTDQGLTSRRTGTVEERYTFEFEGKKYRTTAGTWRTTRQGMERLVSANRILATASQIRYKKYFDDFGALSLTNFWEDVGGGIQSRSDPKIYVVQTNTSIIERCLLMTTDPGDLVLDPTCGSGTTAYVAEQWGRRWITIDTSRVALALARTRLMAAKFPYYYLADDYPNWTQHVADDELKKYLRKNAPASDPKSGPDIRKGMVYKRVPHVTLKSIANNPDITEGMTREAIDAAIARHADTETLFDKPYEDNKRLRVSGPFTVESLSPHRTISVADKKERSEVGKGGLKIQVIGPDDFGTMILDNLRKAGIQNTIKNERLKFDTLDPYPGEWIHGRGTFTEQPSSPRPAAGRGAGGEGLQKSVAICIGPEYGTVGPALVKEAAKEAVKGVGFDLLVVCGFAFDPHVSEEAKRYGKLTVLPARMNPDLAMGDELLKKTGAGNLFMIFGEPDVEIRNVGQASSLPDSKLKGRAGKMPTPRGDQFVVEIKGLDVYDPTTGEIRNSSTDDIACWFIDTDYNDESFFVRHAYFTGADEPYAKLQRALRAEIDEAAWSSLYSTTSRPIDKPESGKIAVKVINHYGDEVMKVFDV